MMYDVSVDSVLNDEEEIKKKIICMMDGVVARKSARQPASGLGSWAS
jgi:hypothetical protein